MRRYAWQLAAAFVLAAFLAAGTFSYVRVTEQFGLFMAYFRTGNWIATQANIELARLAEDMARYQAEPGDETRARMLQRLDIFWSRLPLVLDGEEGVRIRALSGVAAAVEALVADLPNLERDLRRLDGVDRDAYRLALARLETYREPLRRMLQLLLVHDSAAATYDTIRTRQYDVLLAFGLVGIAGAVLWLLLARSLRAANRAYDKAREAEAATKLAHEQLEDAIESISEGFVLYDRDERLVIANDQYKGFYPTVAAMVQPGVKLEDLLRASAQRRQYASDYDAEEWTQTRLAQHRDPKGPFVQYLADGRVLRISDRRTRNGGIVSVRAEITDLVRAEALLMKRLAAIEAAPDGIAMVDAQGRLQYVNKALAELYGEAPDAIVGRDWSMLFAGADRTQVPEHAARSVASERRWRGSAAGQRADGSSFPMELGLSATGDGGLVLAMRNVEHELAMQQEHIRLEHQFQQAQKMEAIGRLAGGIAHDFNNILAAIVGYAAFLAEDLAPGTPQAGFAAKIGTAAGHAKRLVQQILAFSRLQDIERHAVDPRQALNETADLLRPTLPPTTRLVVEAADTPCTVLANPTQINQVLMNLCVNANDALDGRPGTIAIGLEGPVPAPPADGAPADAGVAHAMAGTPSPHQRYVRLSVCDDGIGMPQPVMQRMFDPFFTTKEVGKGTGLGLAAVHGIVLAHGGLILAESRKGKGTSFHIYLPVYDADDAAAGDAQDATLPRGCERVLIVDDQAMVGNVIATALERLGYDVTQCASAEDAIDAIGENADAWDLIVTDLRMPGLGGMELARFARSVRPDLPVVLCSGYADRLTEIQARTLGIGQILGKPVDRAKLAAAVREALDAAARDRGPAIDSHAA